MIVSGVGGAIEHALHGQRASEAGDTGQDGIILQAIGAAIRVERIVGGDTKAVFSSCSVRSMPSPLLLKIELPVMSLPVLVPMPKEHAAHGIEGDRVACAGRAPNHCVRGRGDNGDAKSVSERAARGIGPDAVALYAIVGGSRSQYIDTGIVARKQITLAGNGAADEVPGGQRGLGLQPNHCRDRLARRRRCR